MSRAWPAAALTVAAAAALVFSGDPRRGGTPLWTGARHTREQRDRAIQRGMMFIYRNISRNPKVFEEWGHDLLWMYYNIWETSSDPALRQMAWSMGHERALEYRRLFPDLPDPRDIGWVSDLINGNDAAERLGVPDPRLHAQLARAAHNFTVYDFLRFDPAREPPPTDLPRECDKCGYQNARGATVCARCGARLEMRNRYDIFQDALITAYSGESAGIIMGAPYRDVLRWLPAMRPYPRWTGKGEDKEYYAAVYTITHEIYTFNGYSRFRVSRDCFPTEFEYLEANLRHAEADEDPETMGEYLDSLRSFGPGFENALIRDGFDYLLSVQNPDGSWGDVTDPDPYGRYHPTWTAIDGLRDYRWKKVLPCP